jgi:nitrilase
MAAETRTIRAAVVQAGSTLFDTPATMEKLSRLAMEASAKWAELSVFPEAFVGGYPKGLDFGTRVGSRSLDGREWFRRYYESAIAVPGPECDEIGAIAQENRLEIVVGVIERDGGTLYCTALIFGSDGSLLARHRKVMPTAMERLIWGSGDGSTLSVVPTSLGRIGAVICWENYMPLLRTAMYAQGVELYCAPTVDDRDTWPITIRHIAMEGRCFVLSAVQYLTRADCPADFHPIQGDAPGTVLIRGGSSIAGPLGEEIVAPVYGRETVSVADLDLGDIARGRFDLDPVGHYARPDIFRLDVDTRAKPSVTLGGDEDPSR